MMKKIGLIISVLMLSFSGFSQDDAEAHFKRGERFLSSGNYEKALGSYNQAISLDSENPNYLLRRGFCHNALKDFNKAIADYSTILGMQPNNVNILVSRGSSYNELKQYEKALADFNSAINLDPKNQQAYNNRGWTKKGLGDHKGACNDWKTSKKMGNAEAKIILKNTHCK